MCTVLLRFALVREWVVGAYGLLGRPQYFLRHDMRSGLAGLLFSPSRGLFVLGLDSQQVVGVDGLEPDFAAAIARAYNDWLRDFCAHAPERMLGAGMVAPHDVAAAVAAQRLRRSVAHSALVFATSVRMRLAKGLLVGSASISRSLAWMPRTWPMRPS